MGDVGAGWIKRAQEDAEALRKYEVLGVDRGYRQLHQAFQRIEKLHAARHHSVVLHALVVRGHLLQSQVDFATHPPDLLILASDTIHDEPG